VAYVLVVEDETDHRAILREILRWAGHDVRTVGDVASAREALSRQHPDLVILDLHLAEGESGFTLLAELRAVSDRRQIPIIACTGEPDALDLARLDGRFSAVFTKPFAIASLVEAVDALTGVD
jgi:two-component system alkaline phosphatase synthesis response regulator PhoP